MFIRDSRERFVKVSRLLSMHGIGRKLCVIRNFQRQPHMLSILIQTVRPVSPTLLNLVQQIADALSSSRIEKRFISHIGYFQMNA